MIESLINIKIEKPNRRIIIQIICKSMEIRNIQNNNKIN
jgi:hypothetical protein